MFTITLESINQMLQIQKIDSVIHFSVESLNDLYQKISFPQRAQIFEIFFQKTLSCLRKILPIYPPFSLLGPTRLFLSYVTC
jgi:hypothetical protein